VIIDYVLAARPAAVTLDVMDASGSLVRHFSSAPIAPVAEAARPSEPNFWLATPAPMPTSVGENRMNWDLRYDAPPAFTHTFEINANPGLTPPSPEGPLALPGIYTMKLTVDGRSYAQTVAVRNDPRSPATLAALSAQHALQMKLVDGLRATWNGYQQVAALRGSMGTATGDDMPAELTAAGTAFGAQLDTVIGLDAARAPRSRGGATPPPNFRGVSGALVAELNAQDNADMAPTAATVVAYAKTCAELDAVVARWKQVAGGELTRFNAVRKRHRVRELTAPSVTIAAPRC
jgi:hypothetical protein